MASSRRQYPFHLIEPKWQKAWEEQQAFRAFNPGEEIPANHPFAVRHKLSGKVAATQLPEKFYILDMFPYPSGTGLHVGHPEGYTATDILARYRRACGFNVLHPMGWDSFGLPAEQYAVKTGQHPRKTTEENIATFKRQIKSLGFSYDWSRELATTDVEYFKWTQWIFLKLYNSWFNPVTNAAEPIQTLSPLIEDVIQKVKAGDGSIISESQLTMFLQALPLIKQGIDISVVKKKLEDSKRLAYVSEAPVWWCEQLGTVLANEEVIDGKSEVGGFPVIRKPMRQWMLRITKYAERLLNDLDTIDWTDSLKEMQRNWIGRSEGAEVHFESKTLSGKSETDYQIQVFTTRPDTLFGATYLVLSPEHSFVDILTMPEQRDAVAKYKVDISKKSDLERTELAKEKTGVFTGAFAINPVNGEKIPIWIADYVLASYGTGAIMAVPAHDERDWEFAAQFRLPIQIVVQSSDQRFCNRIPVQLNAADTNLLFHPDFKPEISFRSPANFKGQWVDFASKAEAENFFASRAYDFGEIVPSPSIADGANINSSFLDNLPTAEAKKKITAWLEEKGLGKKTINYKLRDWLFSRQRYWGEPFPIIWKKDAAGNLYHEALPESSLPVLPPTLEDYKPTATGEPPLARAKDWVNLPDGSVRETNTMPQWAGSCWYYLRYTDAKNAQSFVGKDADDYWMASNGKAAGVDLYVGGTEHAVLHLLYARFWHKVLFDLGYVATPEPFYKLVNQGLILGEPEITAFTLENGTFVSAEKVKDISEESTEAGLRLFGFHQETGEKVFGRLVRADETTVRNFKMVLKTDSTIVVDSRSCKMSKSRGNVVNPDDVLVEYGADAFRLYEMFMGPLQDTKPWNTKGVEGVYRFLGRVWRLFVDEKAETAFEQAETTTKEQSNQELLDLILLDGAIAEMDATPAQLKALHACIKKVTEDLDGMRFNTAISAMMVFINEAITWQTKPLPVMKTFLQLLAPFAPHLAEELWARLHSTFGQTAPSLAYAPWPKFDAALLVESEIEIPVQVNGKLRDVVKVSVNATVPELEALALANEKAKPYYDGKTIKKIIVVPKKLVNVVAV